MNLLGVDYGQKRIGLAWVQEGLDVVLPFGTILKETKEAHIAALVAIIQKEKIDRVVFGLPLNEEGQEAQNTKRVREFAAALSQKIQADIVFEDERYTSHEADEMGGNASRDEKAAMVILSRYLEHQT
jgi:putative holliday junction resolvase